MNLHLSPLTLDRLRHTDIGDQAPNTGADYSEYKRWACESCSQVHRDEYDAEHCCPRTAYECYVHPDTGEQFDTYGELASAMAGNPGAPVECPVCRNPAKDFHDAANCCLWKDLSVGNRMSVADAVEAGSTWQEALGVSP